MFSVLRPGEILSGKYEITGVLGEGAMGAVYKGRHVHFQREVAIKILHPLLSRDRVMLRRFEREAQAAGLIGSEHIVKLLDSGSFAGRERYLVMEYLEGESLAARLDRLGTIDVKDAYAIALQLLDGLAAAHDARFVHRDLKPSNVFLVNNYEGRDDFVKILDFGISKLNAVDAGDVTQTGVLLGTPHFMAPELIRGARHADHRSDLYAVGVILYRALTGLTPFVGASAYELLHKIAHEQAPRVRNFAPDVDEDFAAIVDRALMSDPDYRFADARAFTAALRDWSHGKLVLPPLRAPSGTLSPPQAPAPTQRRGLAWLWIAAGAAIASAGFVTMNGLLPSYEVERVSAGSLARSGHASASGIVMPVVKPKPGPTPPVDKEKPAARRKAPRRAAPPPEKPASSGKEPSWGYAPDVSDVTF